MPMLKKKKIPVYKLTFARYLKIIFLSILNPTKFPHQIILGGSLIKTLIFFTINTFLGLLIFISIETTLTKRISLFFLGVGQSLFYTPLIVGVLIMMTFLI